MIIELVAFSREIINTVEWQLNQCISSPNFTLCHYFHSTALLARWVYKSQCPCVCLYPAPLPGAGKRLNSHSRWVVPGMQDLLSVTGGIFITISLDFILTSWISGAFILYIIDIDGLLKKIPWWLKLEPFKTPGKTIVHLGPKVLHNFYCLNYVQLESAFLRYKGLNCLM